ncbi:hypothetical protein D3C71_1672340 [compost metagenome]
MVATTGVSDLTHESLHKYAIDSVLLHPFKMKVDGRIVMCAIEFSGLSIFCHKRTVIGYLIGADVWPKIDICRTRLESVFSTVMVPSAVCTIRRTIEPALVAGHNKAAIRVVLFLCE